MELKKINPEFPEPNLILKAVSMLRQEQPVVFPTETVYGLGTPAWSQKGLEAVYQIKGRPENKPLQVMISDTGMLDEVAVRIPPKAAKLMEKFWPGPLTLILGAKPGLSPRVTARFAVAVRFPDHPVPKALIAALGSPLAATSANVSGRRAPITAQEAQEQLHGKVPLFLDGGKCAYSAESTIVDCTKEPFKILRPGAVPLHQIKLVIT